MLALWRFILSLTLPGITIIGQYKAIIIIKLVFSRFFLGFSIFFIFFIFLFLRQTLNAPPKNLTENLLGKPVYHLAPLSLSGELSLLQGSIILEKFLKHI